MSGNVVARAIGLLVMPMLTRLYDPESFGLVAVYTAIVVLTASLATLRYEVAIPLPKTDSFASNILAVSVALMCTSVIALSVVLFIFGGELLHLVSAEGLIPYSWLIVVGTFGAASSEIMSYWAIRKKAFKIMSKSVASRAM